jgi:tRNA 2-thiouridine synthesizing protein A
MIDTYTINQSLDFRGLACPLPIAKTAIALKALQSGDVVEVLATDPGSVADFGAWSAKTGNQLLESSVQDGVHRFIIRKR